ncbi:S8 family serine peptidase [bacterium]|nr:S8 family serine peptidase [bacterium]MCB1220141.1 S8 family serine peptidase [bacterium]UNM07803.1 MAG: S8 family serine peptidase [Planctomycetales bacterium]
MAGRVTEISLADGTLRWTYRNAGDYNGDGQVTINDLTNIGLHYQKTPLSEDWARARSADGNGDGEINIGDITPMGQNYLSDVAGYKVLNGDSETSSLVELADVKLEEAVVDSDPLIFEVGIDTAALTGMLFVMPYDSAGGTGELSKGIPVGGGSSIDSIPGSSSDPLANHISTYSPPAPPASDFTQDTARSGLFISRTRFVVCMQPDVSVGETNLLLSQVGGRVIGAMTGINMLVIEVDDPGDLSRVHNAIDTFDASPHVLLAVEDCLMSTLNVNNPSNDSDSSVFGLANQAVPNPWRWDWPPSENGVSVNGNWGIEAVRAPFAWNLFDYGRRQGDPARTIVLDTGFNNAHNDDELDNLSLKTVDGNDVIDGFTLGAHGSHVAGTVGAPHYNNAGVAGMNPLFQFVDVDDELWVGMTCRISSFNGGTYQGRETCFDSTVFDIFFAWDEWNDVAVVNTSLGYNWANAGIDTAATERARELARDQGMIMRYIAFVENAKLLCTAAGNDSTGSNGWPTEQDAVWASPMCWAALDPEIAWPDYLDLGPSANIIVVESSQAIVADNTLSENSWQYTKSDFSNVGGHVSAPGSDILSVVGNNLNDRNGNPYQDYETFSGTSMATPLVTGLVSYIASLAPDLDAGQIRSLLTDAGNTRPVALEQGATLPAGIDAPARQVDAFAAVTSIDDERGNREIQRALVDVDDGTRDGNLRTRVCDDAGYTNPMDPDPDGIETADQRRGDGETTMKDFRAFRDAWLYAAYDHFSAEVDLDGNFEQFKKDFNFDGAVQYMSRNGRAAAPPHPLDIPTATVLNDVIFEDRFSRYDFNGDGQLADWSATAPYRIACTTAAGSNPTSAVNQVPGMVRDLDVMLSAGNWQSRDILYEQNGDPEYFENISILPADEGMITSQHWSPKRYLLENRDASAAVDQLYKDTPDYLQSCDIHFNLDWSYLLLGGSNSVEITVTSEIDGVVDPFVRTATFKPSDPWKFVLTVPIWSNTINIDWNSNGGFSSNTDLNVKLGSDVPYRINSFYQVPGITKQWTTATPRLEPVLWYRYLGAGEGYRLHTIFAEDKGNDNFDINYSMMQSTDGLWSDPKVVANADGLVMMAGADLYGFPAIVFSNSDGQLLFKTTVDGNDWDSHDRTIDTGADFDFAQLGFLQHGGEQNFIVWSKGNGVDGNSVYFSRSNDFTAYTWAAPQEIGKGHAPALASIDNADGLFLVMFDPLAGAIGSAVKLFQWNTGMTSFGTPDPLPLDGILWNAGEQISGDIGSFNGNAGLVVRFGNEMYWFDGIDGESIDHHFVGNYNGQLDSWIRPQVFNVTGKPAVFIMGLVYQSQDTSGIGWENAVVLDTRGTEPSRNLMRIRGHETGLLSCEFFDEGLDRLVVQTDFLH